MDTGNYFSDLFGYLGIYRFRTLQVEKYRDSR
jgi:hypothetical protein